MVSREMLTMIAKTVNHDTCVRTPCIRICILQPSMGCTQVMIMRVQYGEP